MQVPESPANLYTYLALILTSDYHIASSNLLFLLLELVQMESNFLLKLRFRSFQGYRTDKLAMVAMCHYKCTNLLKVHHQATNNNWLGADEPPWLALS